MSPVQGASFELQAFAREPGLALTGELQFNAGLLRIDYELNGSLASLKIPAGPAGAGHRTDRLWEHTCFEFFVGLESQESYWEFNASPSGNWAAYRFASYRTGMREEAGISSLRVSRKGQAGVFGVELEARLQDIPEIQEHLLKPESKLLVGITAVLEKRDGKMSYWALTHPRAKPDFHDRAAFLIRLRKEGIVQ
ncbi:MAG TPA: DOMON-like domain-containing protein [Bdellovibrionota bacterium]|nr:DOMON-like domain-containing protein [Bdellovibrionota bacterium]